MKSFKSANYKIWTVNNQLSIGDGKSPVGGQDTVLNTFPSSQGDFKKTNDSHSEDDSNQTLKNSLTSFTLAVMSSILIATGTACVQVSKGNFFINPWKFSQKSTECFF